MTQGEGPAKKELLEIAASRPGLVAPHKLLAEIATDEGRPADAADIGQRSWPSSASRRTLRHSVWAARMTSLWRTSSSAPPCSLAERLTRPSRITGRHRKSSGTSPRPSITWHGFSPRIQIASSATWPAGDRPGAAPSSCRPAIRMPWRPWCRLGRGGPVLRCRTNRAQGPRPCQTTEPAGPGRIDAGQDSAV